MRTLRWPTNEMIEAGAKRYQECPVSEEYPGLRSVLAEVYLAMEGARPEGSGTLNVDGISIVDLKGGVRFFRGPASSGYTAWKPN